eukprot:TRINITY_DN20339_c0_g1_i1.p1 TRINITY_DN20339_c0_g1~~TRINITY_DN20339_c0_g1_i1.p1  ORF type:complete len:198 (+),score=5.32 TRINITY_DN20339_c0_g1_i1:64-594(+)
MTGSDHRPIVLRLKPQPALPSDTPIPPLSSRLILARHPKLSTFFKPAASKPGLPTDSAAAEQRSQPPDTGLPTAAPQDASAVSAGERLPEFSTLAGPADATRSPPGVSCGGEDTPPPPHEGSHKRRSIPLSCPALDMFWFPWNILDDETSGAGRSVDVVKGVITIMVLLFARRFVK